MTLFMICFELFFGKIYSQFRDIYYQELVFLVDFYKIPHLIQKRYCGKYIRSTRPVEKLCSMSDKKKRSDLRLLGYFELFSKVLFYNRLIVQIHFFTVLAQFMGWQAFGVFPPFSMCGLQTRPQRIK
jgi:hypothetical protein